MTNANDPINPVSNELSERESETGIKIPYGLTKREYFAAMAMQGLLANSDYQTNISDGAVKCADALIAELNK